MEKNLILEYPVKVKFVNEIEIRGYEILVCKNPRNKGIVREKVFSTKRNMYKKRNKKL